MTRSAICGTDLHLWHGTIPVADRGFVVGHECVGVVEEVGSGVKTLAKGDRVFASLDAAGHDPEIFRDAEDVDISRRRNRHMAFGKGIHYCMGAPLSRVEGAVALEAILDRMPNAQGFDYFYGFLAGETSQWEPTLWENTTPITPPHVENYEDFHLTEAMADKAITWMRTQRALAPDKPFLMYWAPGAVHGPHHVTKKWADKYKGKFDQGYDKLREEIFASTIEQASGEKPMPPYSFGMISEKKPRWRSACQSSGGRSTSS